MYITRLSQVSLVLAANFGLVLGDSNQNSNPAVRGVDPQLLPKYKANAAGQFTCLDGSQQIPIARVNDDYCDCADGSDEPGTSACANGTFYCANKGHLPGRLSAWRVNDGICDYDVCCDGSDEWDTDAACPDKCEEIGKLHRHKVAEQQRIEEAGGKRLAELIANAGSLRRTKQKELDEKRARLAEVEAELAAAEKRKEALEKQQHDIAESTGKLQSLSDQYLPSVVSYRKQLAAELHVLRAQRDRLILMLRSVRVDHNPEFNDPAVASAIKEYSEFVDAYPYMEQAALAFADEDDAARTERLLQMDQDNMAEDDGALDKCNQAVEIAEAEMATAHDDIDLFVRLLENLRDGYNKNYHDLAVKAAVSGLSAFEADRSASAEKVQKEQEEADFYSLKQQYDEMKPQLEQLLAESSIDENVEAEAKEEDSNDQKVDLDQQVTEARTAYWDIHSTLNRERNEVDQLKSLLEESDLGPNDMYLSVKGECHKLDTGEYTYEVCLLDRVTQISNKDNARQSLGTFESFAEGSNHTKHNYLHGTKCWNGPERSIVVQVICNEHIQLLSVSELEKCEYQATMAAPFACPIADAAPEMVENTLEDNIPDASIDGNSQHGNGHVHDEL
ncbi:hypothetical protein H4R20_002638 [Coemansia guatemalensis]|uniref:Glucosidase 2 subunit beta n=1 Tax=Coemansia guatemalensis TaxID=2761395 RepID=A0A9W8HZL2_9FUNG|nr:hypothetical protein H4R20_002638 [Coemansia guatemalensis]